MKDIDDLKKEITEAIDQELDPREKVIQLDQEYDYHLARINEGKNWLRDAHPDAFRKDAWTSPKWLQRGKLGKRLAPTSFEEVFAELAEQALPLNPASRELTRNLGGYAWEGQIPEKEMTLPDGTIQPAEKKRMDLIVIPDVGEISEELGMSKRNVRRYIVEMVRCGILLELPKKLGKGQRGFKIGEWTYYWDKKIEDFKARRLWLLKSTDKEMLAKLLTFKVYSD